jgi:outer membrane immunogenic protein
MEKTIARARNTTFSQSIVVCISPERARIRVPPVGGIIVMEKLLFAGAAAVTLIAANTASAADLGLPMKGPAMEAAWNWSGFYAGLNAGYARGTTVWNDLDGTFTAGGSLFNESDNGFIGGGQIGYNWQFRHAVFGLETDFEYLSLNQTTGLFTIDGAGAVAENFHDSMRWLGTVRGRAGLAVDNVLTYLTAGLAYGRADHSVSDVTIGIPESENTQDFSSTKAGPVGGVGMECRHGIWARSALVGEGRSLVCRSRKAHRNISGRQQCHCDRSPGDSGHDVDRPRRRELQIRRLLASHPFRAKPGGLRSGPGSAADRELR